jgi:cell division protein FtsW (lipid II flippase)
MGKRSKIHRTQALVLSFFTFAWIGLVVILLAVPQIYDQSPKLLSVDHQFAELAVFAAITVLLIILGLGVIRRWRWTFWVVLVAFVAGILRAPAAVLDLTGVYTTGEPGWYALFKGTCGPGPVHPWPGDAVQLPAKRCLGLGPNPTSPVPDRRSGLVREGSTPG